MEGSNLELTSVESAGSGIGIARTEAWISETTTVWITKSTAVWVTKSTAVWSTEAAKLWRTDYTYMRRLQVTFGHSNNCQTKIQMKT